MELLEKILEREGAVGLSRSSDYWDAQHEENIGNVPLEQRKAQTAGPSELEGTGLG